VPDENFASSEHELIQEITAPFSAVREDPEVDPGEADFPIVLRGYDRLAVDAYIKQTRELIDDLRATSTPEAAVRRALERVGEEVSGILQRAHDTAEKITSQSRSEAEDRMETARNEAAELKAEAERELERAHQDAAEIRAQAEAQLTDLDAETDRIWAERHRIVEDTRELSRQLLAVVDSAAERFPPAEDTETGETMPVTDRAGGELARAEPQKAEGNGEGEAPYDHAASTEERAQPPKHPAEPAGEDSTAQTSILPPRED
jgi:cell division septum initiation protein DivIVA